LQLGSHRMAKRQLVVFATMRRVVARIIDLWEISQHNG
jgi:hypothetical protein